MKVNISKKELRRVYEEWLNDEEGLQTLLQIIEMRYTNRFLAIIKINLEIVKNIVDLIFVSIWELLKGTFLAWLVLFGYCLDGDLYTGLGSFSKFISANNITVISIIGSDIALIRKDLAWLNIAINPRRYKSFERFIASDLVEEEVMFIRNSFDKTMDMINNLMSYEDYVNHMKLLRRNIVAILDYKLTFISNEEYERLQEEAA